MPETNPSDALGDVIGRLEAIGVAYMLTGSGAGMLYGLSRSTADFDVVIDLAHEHVAPLVEAFHEDYYIDHDAALDAVNREAMFNIVPLQGGLKVDFIVLRDEPFDMAAFQRRQQIDWHGTLVWAISPGDLVLSKLRWAQITYSDRQLADVRAIMASGRVDEDDDFRSWIDRLRLQELLDASRTTRHDA